MKNLITWFHREHHFPYCSYIWDALLGENIRRSFVSSGILNYDANNSSVNEFYIRHENYKVSRCGNGYIAIGDFGRCYEMTSAQTKILTFNFKNFAKNVAKALGISSSVSALGYGCDGFFLGNVILSEHYRVFFRFTSRNFIEYIKPLATDFIPIVITFSEIDSPLEMLISKHNGKCIEVEELVSFSEQGLSVKKELASFLDTSRRAKNSKAYYSWRATKLPVPENPTLKLLSMDLISPSEVKIKFGEHSIRVHYSDVSLFKSNDSMDVSFAWKVICACALKKELKGYDKKNLPRYTSRLNSNFRDFFGFDGRAFSCIEGSLKNNFLLTAYEYLSTRSRAEVFCGNELKSSDEFIYPTE